jgi:hypothetical protein
LSPQWSSAEFPLTKTKISIEQPLCFRQGEDSEVISAVTAADSRGKETAVRVDKVTVTADAARRKSDSCASQQSSCDLQMLRDERATAVLVDRDHL